jgi:light-regulated signal transduction histidine kinase (bacteriophytochrome)
MGRLIDDMLSLSRVSRAEMRLEKVNLSILVQEILNELSGREPQRKAVFSVSPEIEGTGDSRFLRIALENLLGNAWKFTGRCSESRIEFGRTKIENQTVYYVRDNGSGFNMQHVEKLFGVFQRLHTEAEFPGTGIGLATVQRIIRRHGGRIWAESAVGNGATFYFTLS